MTNPLKVDFAELFQGDSLELRIKVTVQVRVEAGVHVNLKRGPLLARRRHTVYATYALNVFEYPLVGEPLVELVPTRLDM